jgi:hypothetical protein
VRRDSVTCRPAGSGGWRVESVNPSFLVSGPRYAGLLPALATVVAARLGRIRWIVVADDDPVLAGEWLGPARTLRLSRWDIAAARERLASIHDTYAEAAAAVRIAENREWDTARHWWSIRAVRVLEDC